MTVRVLVVDDSPMVRHALTRILSSAGDIEVVGSAPDPYQARDLIVSRSPDVLTLDVEMPRMDGITFLKKLMHFHPMPVVVVSTLTVKGGAVALEALAAGAVEVVCKPASAAQLLAMSRDLVGAVRAAGQAKVRRHASPVQVSHARPARRGLVAIGASTGGTVALEHVLSALPAQVPPLVVVQHMPAGFTGSFAARLATVCRVRVREAQDGDALEPGLALLAPGDKQMVVHATPQGLRVGVADGPRVSGHRPSVDVLFRSVARAAGSRAVGVILTGMGADGAAGLLELRRAGARTLGQDEASSVVYGMPKAAFDAGAVERQVTLHHLAASIIHAVEDAAPGGPVAAAS